MFDPEFFDEVIFDTFWESTPLRKRFFPRNDYGHVRLGGQRYRNRRQRYRGNN